MLRRVLLALAAALVVAAALLAVSGGFRVTVGGLRVSARSPLAASVAALLATVTWLQMARRDRSVAADLEAAWRGVERHSTRVIGTIALVSAIVASVFATRSAAGADASGYLSEADMWSRLAMLHAEPAAADLVDQDSWMTVPLGWRPAAEAGMQVPTYPPGLPLLMALPHAIAGVNGATAVVTASAALAVWSTGLLAGGPAGVIAAILLAFTPVFLYQSFQPMSDVPVTAAWMLCLFCARNGRHGWSGVAGAAAILIRPNLAPIAIVPLLLARPRWRFAVPAAVAAGVLAAVQTFWYGAPWRSGYGNAEELFALSNVVPNGARYVGWLVATAPVLLLAPAAFIRLRRDLHARALMIFAGLVACAYLVYAVFEHWSYLRFWLPAMAVLAVLAGVQLAAWIERVPVRFRFLSFLALSLGIAAHGLFVARTLDTFKIRDQLRRVAQVADAINHTAPPHAVIIAGEQSGSMRYYTGRSILRWEAATSETLPKAVEVFLKAGKPIYIVLDAWEMELFRARFPNVGPAELDWPPMLEAGSSHRTLAWNVADRWRYQLGQRVNTVRLP